MVPRKIEVGCWAMIRATGEVVQVHKLYRGLCGNPNLWGCSDHAEYMASELKRVTPENAQQIDQDNEIRMWEKCGF